MTKIEREMNRKPIEIPPTPFGKGGDRASVNEVNIEQLKQIYQIFKAYQQANVSPKPNLSERV